MAELVGGSGDESPGDARLLGEKEYGIHNVLRWVIRHLNTTDDTTTTTDTP